ncbi:Uncharacterised protein [Mycobacteroides abscessus subsp. massiliense]|uniref:hypothetical protein n=1 Tax=Mycobacteroides abscessus TaxID=36809 RepID=UPI0009A6FC1C|nr:hypothetical protein [Mycobacteroides abscessus]SLH92523.1 Uncharacterised protein [Mycobacteroides abscessus subsp. massiliense]SLI30504.1 Uncharacterised protein [Mycobacteroides abscessus subsp. massiliense]
MSELLDRAREAIAVCICHGDNDNPNIEISMSLVSELIEAVEYSTKVIQERDEALWALDKVTE